MSQVESLYFSVEVYRMKILGFPLTDIKIMIKNIIIWVLSALVPKDKQLYLIGGWFGERFADNSRYLYLYNYIDSQTPKKVVWITSNEKIYKFLKNASLPVEMKGTWKSKWLHLKAGTHIIDQCCNDLDGYYSVRANRINVWHGIPMKKIWTEKKTQGGRVYSSLRDNGWFSAGRWSNFSLVVPSEFSENLFKQCLTNPKCKVIRRQYPRINYLRSKNRDRYYLTEFEKLQIEQIKKKKHDYNIVMYFPTFRDTSSTFPFGASDKKQLDELFNKLSDLNILIVMKPHFAEHGNVEFNYPNLLLLDKDADIYPFLPISDALITDYSSICFDYLVLDKPIVYNPYDYDFYKNSDRGLLLDYDNYTPGYKAYNVDELLNVLSDLKNNDWKDNFKEERTKLATLLFDEKFPMLLG